MRLALITSNVILLLLTACISYRKSPYPGLSNSSPTLIKTKADSFYVTGSNWKSPWGYAIGATDTVSPGTDGYKGGYMQLITKEDTAQFNYTSTPFRQHHLISVVSPKDTTVCILRFNQHTAEYSDVYMKEHEGKVDFVIPETFELANIIWLLSANSKYATNLHTQGKYYEEIIEYFKPYQSHPIFNKLNSSEDKYFENYYSLRENSVGFKFEGDSLRYSGPYFHVYGGFERFGGLFRELQPLIEDFVKQSRFRVFFKNHSPYYDELIKRQKQLMPIEKMWSWLEKEFPRKITSYKIVFSPLIGGSHSTQNFSFMGNRRDWFTEALMFTSGPETVDENKLLNEKQKEGLLSGVVFTEIDHNYVNPITGKYRKEVEEIFGNRRLWCSKGADADNYNSGESVFNEYMTHALFCVYVLDNYDQQTARFIIDQRESLMTNRRQFIRFPQFHAKLAELYKNKDEQETVIDLYPRILEWAKSAN